MRIPQLIKTGIVMFGALAALVFFAASARAAGPPETPVTEAATGLAGTTATLNGTLNPKKKAKTGWYFAYNTNGSCTEGSTTEPGAEVTGRALKVPTPVTSLVPSTQYTFCLVASNAAEESTSGLPLTFETLAVKPAVESETNSSVTPFAATLEAQVNPENQATTSCVFEYGKTVAYGASVPCEQGVLEGSVSQLASARLAELEPAETYHYRIVVENATGVTEGNDGEFTTVGPPRLTTGEAQSPTRTTVTLSGTVNPEGAETIYHFGYIDQPGYEAAIAESAPDRYAKGAGTAPFKLEASREIQAVGPVPVEELRPETTYHYALVATNAAGTEIGEDETFTTAPATKPIVATGAAVEVTPTSAVVVGALDTRGLQTSYDFELGTEARNYSPQGFASAGSIAGTQAASRQLSYLIPGVTYHYRLCATNYDGTTCGADQTFTTPGVPNPVTLPASPPLLATPAIPTESPPGIGVLGTTTRRITNAQKLSKALKACVKKPKSKRASCQRQARKKYVVNTNAKGKKKHAGGKKHG
jgi:hypothetical protein